MDIDDDDDTNIDKLLNDGEFMEDVTSSNFDENAFETFLNELNDTPSEDNELLRSNVKSVRHVSVTRSPLVQGATYSSMAVVFLGVVQCMIGFFGGGKSTNVSVVFGLLGVLCVVIATVVLLGFRRLSSEPECAVSMLSYGCHGGTIISGYLLIFGVGVLSVGSLLWKYVELHWHDGLDVVYGTSLVEAQEHVRVTVVAICVVALVTVVFLWMIIGCIIMMELDGFVFGEQTLLWCAIATCASGCVLIGVNQYIWFHQGSVPISHNECLLAHVLGCALFVLSLVTLLRIHQWPRMSTPVLSAVHAGGCLLMFVFLSSFASILFFRSTNIDAYLGTDNEFAHFGKHDLGHDDNDEKLKLSAQIQLSIVGLTNTCAAIFALVGGVVFVLLDRFMIQEQSMHTRELKSVNE